MKYDYFTETDNSILLIGNYLNFNKNQFIVLVEGQTDKMFYDRVFSYYKINNIKCYCVDTLFNKSNSDVNDNKKIISDVILKIKNNTFTNCKIKTFNGQHVFGIVDRDYGVFEPYSKLSNLIYDDIHDLEMLMISEDNNLLASSFNEKLTDEEVIKANTIEYQHGLINASIVNNKKIIGFSSISTLKIKDFCINDEGLNVSKYFYLLNNSKKVMNKKIKEVYTLVLDDIKPYFDNRKWNLAPYDFINSLPDNFYQLVKGHNLIDFLILFKNPSIDETTLYQKRKEVECKMISSSNMDLFKNTKIFSIFSEKNII